MNLANLGLAAMNAAQNRLNTAGHNINNADTDGYNRQRVITATAGAVNMGSGYIGRGVEAVTVQRSYDNFLYRQLVSAQSGGAALVSYGNEITQVNNLFADNTTGISPALQKFFAGMNAVASSPADPAARQELLGRAASLVGQINDTNAFLDSQRGNINTQITTVVTQVNSYVERIGDLNKQILSAKASSSGHAPNDLLDQRDQLVSELNTLVGVKVVPHGDDTISLTIGNGQLVLGGNTAYPLQAVQSASDPTRTVIAYSTVDASGNMSPIEIDESYITGGSLGGLVKYRQEALDAVQNDLGRMAAGLAIAINELHENGVDANGADGVAFFTLGQATAIPHQGNNGAASIKAELTGAGQLTGKDYRITFEGGNYNVVRLPGSTVIQTVSEVDAAANGLEVEGLTLSFEGGAPQEGDTWLLQPTRAAAGSIGLNLTDPGQIAAADADGGSANGNNALAMAGLQEKKVLANGTMSMNEAFSQVVNKVAVLGQQNATAAKAQSSLIQQNYAAQQAVSGVNVNEELVNLDRYLEQFRAASRMIDVSSSLFDTLLSLRN